MEKQNKVIAGLECCLKLDKSCAENCPYFKSYELDGCMDDLMAAALDVLRSGSGDLISRSKFLESIEGTDWYTIRYNGEVSQGAPSEEVAWYKATDIYSAIENAPAVDAVSRGVHDQVRWERDIAIQQLEEHGIPFGGIAPDVVKVVRCKDCKSCSHDVMFGGYWCGGHRVKADDFCSYGERRADV